MKGRLLLLVVCAALVLGTSRTGRRKTLKVVSVKTPPGLTVVDQKKVRGQLVSAGFKGPCSKATRLDVRVVLPVRNDSPKTLRLAKKVAYFVVDGKRLPVRNAHFARPRPSTGQSDRPMGSPGPRPDELRPGATARLVLFTPEVVRHGDLGGVKQVEAVSPLGPGEVRVVLRGRKGR